MSTDTTMPPAECKLLDPYQYVIDCDQEDPCGDDGTYLYKATACDGGSTMAQFCARYPDHPACFAYSTTTVVDVGTPPTLPHTGNNHVAVGVAGWLVFLGIVAVRVARRPKVDASGKKE